MFKELFASLSIFFASLFTNQTDVQQVKPAVQVQQNYKSYFEYISPTQIKARVYFDQDFKSIDTPQAKKSYILKEAEFEIPGCYIDDFNPKSDIYLNDKKFLDFFIVLKKPCYQNRMIFTGKVKMTNIVTVNYKTFVSNKYFDIGPIVLKNIFPVSPPKPKIINIDISMPDEKILINQREKIYYKITDENKNQLPSSEIEKIFISTTDAQRVVLIDGESFVDELILENPKSFGFFEIKTKNHSGKASIKIGVKLKNEEKIFEKYIDLEIIGLPLEMVKIDLDIPDGNLVIGKTYSIKYYIKNAINDELIDKNKIKKIAFSVSDNIKIFFNKQEYKYLTLDDNLKSTGFIYIIPKNPGTASLKMKVFLNDGKILQKNINFSINERENIVFDFSYLGTEYNDSAAMFEDSYLLNSNIDDIEHKVKIGAITPKILYPEIYYDDILKNIIHYHNRNVYYSDIYNGEENNNYGQISPYGSFTIFQNSYFDLTKINLDKDYVVILPNKFNAENEYLGGWKIGDIINNNKIILLDPTKKSGDRLSFVIGNSSRYNFSDDTVEYFYISMIPDKNSTTKMIVKISYPTFFAGKDIFLYVNFYDEFNNRYGNTLKRTLTGTKLSISKIPPCESPECIFNVRAYFDDGNRDYELSRLTLVCDSESNLARPVELTSVLYSNCNGSRVATTSGDGRFRVCVYPKRETNDKNETTYRSEALNCQPIVVEEFTK